MDPFPAVDFEGYHATELPQRLGSLGANAALGARGLDSLALRIAETDEAWTYLPSAERLDLRRGDEGAATVVRIPRKAWEGLVHDLESPSALLYHGQVERVRGDAMQFVRWEAALRALYTGRPVYDESRLDLRDRHGAPLDPAHGFHADDDPDEMAHFLREVGYLWIRALFDADEVAAFRAAGAELSDEARPGDQKSWWGQREDGSEVLCRVLNGGTKAALRGLPTDPRILKLVELADHRMVPSAADAQDGVTMLWKNPGVAEGLSDLPWHRDCGMGGHASMCPTLVGSLFLESNTNEAGALRFLPGSWKASYRFADATDDDAAEGLLLPARPGDLTLHYGDGWHAAPPPTSSEGPFRSCILVGFRREGAANHRGERHYNDVLLGAEDGQIRNMKAVAADT